MVEVVLSNSLELGRVKVVTVLAGVDGLAVWRCAPSPGSKVGQLAQDLALGNTAAGNAG